MLSRRELIGKAAVGAAAALAVGGAVGTAVAATRPRRESTDAAGEATDAPGHGPAEQHAAAAALDGEAAPAPWALVAPLSAGAEVAHGWRLVDLTPVRDGSAAVTLANPRGRTHRIHLCRNDGHPQGLVYTRHVDLLVMNQGYGELPTEEHFGQAVAALAHAIAANEGTAAGIVAALEPHAARVARYAAADDTLMSGKLR